MSPLRQCSRLGCRQPAVATMTYGYREATAVIGPLSPVPQQGAFDLCKDHANSVTVPVGWQMVRLQTEFEEAPPSTDDLLALAEAIREASQREVPPPRPAQREIRRPAIDVSSPARPRPKLTLINGGESSTPADD
ncbi:DUF3499 domain-containing protein [Trueperella pyogenes]|uniref:DUF3499 domain-containing protein n=2 Tax=Trueperella pyogenes TaxID=1661 RepID=X4RCB9_9ACTO|nr:DUF3499 domain-containing protein [Trueperella pyogenes]AHU89450.1 hypothetical protein CQ11_05000 [Trueperella pyogenes]AJC69157.1 hypothetical protein X956_02710 [Trueperella pyogenes TP8]AWA43416.1 DUF3499 domain-containing protein [Trueperella pyogenes]AWG04140.1 DUF3499 domain-containing protein [Trueperella pyogenes]AWG16868.1 DUF3499 domain-containing protein [Trueperella pyogenes]